jgi:glycosyltransferase involved in cell wall biosynthesis
MNSKHKSFEIINVDRNQISLVLPIFAANDLLEQTILSIRDQVDQFDEIVIVDDNPNIESREGFIRNLLGVNISLNYIKNQINLGSASSLNLGVENAKSRTIVLCNDDDLFESTRVQRIRNHARSLTYESYWGYSSVACIDNLGDIIDPDQLPTFLAEAVNENNKKSCSLSSLRYTNPIISTGNLFMTKDLWERAGKFNADLTHVHDWEFATKLKILSTPIYLKDEKYYYRVHPQNSFRKISKNSSRSQVDQLHISCEQFLWSYGSIESICEYFPDMIIHSNELLSSKHGEVELNMLEIRVLRLFDLFLRKIRRNGAMLRLSRYLFDKIESSLLRS